MALREKQRSPTMAEVFNRILTSFQHNIHVSMPGVVKSYDSSTQKADIQPGIQEVLTDDKGEPQVFDLPVLYNVPVIFPRAGDFFISFPISAGDTVLLIFCERPIDQWMEQGSFTAKDAFPPGLRSMHDLNGAVAYAGMYPSANALSEASSSHMVAGKDGGQQIAIEASSGEIHAGESGSSSLEFVALANLVLSELQAVKTQFDAINSSFNLHIHQDPVSGVTGGPSQNPLGLPLTTIPTSPTPSSVASSNLKAED
jgi:hypothetical protein